MNAAESALSIDQTKIALRESASFIRDRHLRQLQR